MATVNLAGASPSLPIVLVTDTWGEKGGVQQSGRGGEGLLGLRLKLSRLLSARAASGGQLLPLTCIFACMHGALPLIT
jgi:hypothetical protein